MAESLRVVTINFWGTEPDLTRRLALAETQLRALAPDVVCMQEVRPMNGRSGPTTAHELGDRLGMNVAYEVTLEWADGAFFKGHPGGQEGLAILSRAAIDEHEAIELPEARPTERRILLSARTSGIWVHTTHLHYRLDDGVAREKQVVAIDHAIRAHGDDAPQIVCGDFNATPDSDEIRFLLGKHTLAGRRTHYQDAYARVHPGELGLTWCAENEHTRPLRSLDIDRRIDFVFVTTRRKDGRGTVLDADVVLTDRDANGDCASDHYGVLAEVQVGP